METEVIDRPTVAEQTPSAIATNIVTVQGEVAKFDKIAAGLAAIEAAHPKNVIVDAINTPAGMRSAEAAWRAWRGPRLEVEKARKAAKAPVLALGKAIDSFAAELETKLLAGEDHYKAQITAEEERRAAEKAEAARKEAERLESMRTELDNILVGWVARCQVEGMTADRVQAGITALTAVMMPPEMQDVAAHWDSAKLLTLGKMENIRLDLAHQELQAQREELARQEAERAAQQAAEMQKARDETARVTGLSRRISEIHAAATGHEKASAWDLFEAITAVESLDVSAAQYQEFAAAAETAQASTLAALRSQHSAAVAREDEQSKAAELAAQRAESERLQQLADAHRATVSNDMMEVAFSGFAQVIDGPKAPTLDWTDDDPDAADSQPAQPEPETVDPGLVLAEVEHETKHVAYGMSTGTLPPMPDHWTTAELQGAPGAFQRAAREYAEAYAALAITANRDRMVEHEAATDRLRFALCKLMGYCITDHDMIQLGWDAGYIAEACDAYNAAKMALGPNVRGNLEPTR